MDLPQGTAKRNVVEEQRNGRDCKGKAVCVGKSQENHNRKMSERSQENRERYMRLRTEAKAVER